MLTIHDTLFDGSDLPHFQKSSLNILNDIKEGIHLINVCEKRILEVIYPFKGKKI